MLMFGVRVVLRHGGSGMLMFGVRGEGPFLGMVEGYVDICGSGGEVVLRHGGGGVYGCLGCWGRGHS
jgi:hypothetical protein